MSFFKPDEDLAQHPFIPRKLLREEPWGEIWRVQNRDLATSMILIAWCTPEGDALFGEIEEGIKRWKEVAGTLNCPHLIPIVDMSDSAIPYVLCEDPGGQSLRDEVMARRNDPPKAEAIAKLGLHLCQGVHEAEAYGCAPVSLTPDSIYACTTDRDNPFKLLPVAPRAVEHAGLMAAGRYLPPEFGKTPSPEKLHADIQAVPWILTEVWRRDFHAPLPSKPRDVVPLKGLASTLESLTNLLQGVYTEPAVATQGLERWLKKQMAADVAEWEKAELERRRGPIINFLVKRAPIMVGALVFVLVAGGTGYGVYHLVSNRPKPSVNTAALVKTEANDMATLFLKAIEEDDALIARDVTVGTDLMEQTDAILRQLKTMRDAGIATPVEKVIRRVAGSGDQRIVEAQLAGRTGAPFAVVVFEMRQRANFEWYVTNAFLKPLRFAP